ncbi:MAG TPA: sulfite exporter TauE/SafE family protein [Gaiellaceae bacterium]
MTWQFIMAGLLVGVLVGMTGMGGGSLMTPMLILIFGFDPKTAVGTDIVHGAIFKSFGAMRHRKLGNVNLPLAAWMLLGSGPCSLVGVELATSFSDGAEATMSKIIGGALILGGLGFLARTFVKPSVDPDAGPFRLSTRDKLFAVLIGASCGFVVGLTSVGSGTFFGLFMLFLFPLSATQMVGTDVTHAAALLWIAGAGYLLHGSVDLHAIAWLLVGSIPGVLLGASLSIKVPDRVLRTSFAFVLMLSGIKLVKLPGATTVIEVVVALGALGIVGWAVRQAQQRRVAVEGPV